MCLALGFDVDEPAQDFTGQDTDIAGQFEDAEPGGKLHTLNILNPHVIYSYYYLH